MTAATLGRRDRCRSSSEVRPGDALSAAGAAGGDAGRRRPADRCCRCFHYYTAGFGLLQEITHRGVHLAFVLGLVFLVFPHRKALLEHPAESRWWRPGGVPLVRLGACAGGGRVGALHPVHLRGPHLPRRQPARDRCRDGIDPAGRAARSDAPLARLAAAGDRADLHAPMRCGARGSRACSSMQARPGAQLINHQYLTSQGIYGVAVGVVATYVFHFVLFGVLATRIGLGQLFLDVASAIAGRYAGGPAKVSVFGSAMFGMFERLVRGQCGHGRLAHHPRDDPRGLQARVRARRWRRPRPRAGRSRRRCWARRPS